MPDPDANPNADSCPPFDGLQFVFTGALGSMKGVKDGKPSEVNVATGRPTVSAACPR